VIPSQFLVRFILSYAMILKSSFLYVSRIVYLAPIRFIHIKYVNYLKQNISDDVFMSVLKFTISTFNYRPIALTCTLCKIVETIIKDQLLDFLLGKKQISMHQHGLMLNHSTLTNLLECAHDWIVGLLRGNNIAVVYFDFNKAFDSIVFSKLLAKLKQFGIVGNLLA